MKHLNRARVLKFVKLAGWARFLVPFGDEAEDRRGRVGKVWLRKEARHNAPWNDSAIVAKFVEQRR